MIAVGRGPIGPLEFALVSAALVQMAQTKSAETKTLLSDTASDVQSDGKAARWDVGVQDDPENS